MLADCDELARAMALSISLSLPSTRGSPTTNADVTAAPSPHDAVESTPTQALTLRVPAAAATSDAPAPDRSRPSMRRRLWLGAAVSASSGTLPDAALGAMAALGYRRESWSVALEGHGLQSLGKALTLRGELSGSLFGLGLTGCRRLGALFLCGHALWGTQRLRTSDVADGRHAAGTFTAFGPRLSWARALGADLNLTLSAQALLNPLRNRARFGGSIVWTAPFVSGGALLGVETSFL